MKQELLTIFENVNNWLKFAEAKNTLLLGFIGVLIGLDIKVIGLVEANPILKWYAWLVLVQLGLACLLSLFSFFPKLQIPFLFGDASVSKGDNLFFFGHISNYDSKAFLQMLKHKGIAFDHVSGIDLDLIEQIIINSQIANCKYKMFNLSLSFVVSAVFTPVAILLSKLFVEGK